LGFGEKFRPISVKSAIFALPASILGGFSGAVLFFLSKCLNGDTNCAAYSPVRQAIAYVMAWPVLTMPVILRSLNSSFSLSVAALVLFAYYYVFIYIAIYLRRKFRKTS
jgi:hypothetical protein